jgi:hypothetical protein
MRISNQREERFPVGDPMQHQSTSDQDLGEFG